MWLTGQKFLAESLINYGFPAGSNLGCSGSRSSRSKDIVWWAPCTLPLYVERCTFPSLYVPINEVFTLLSQPSSSVKSKKIALKFERNHILLKKLPPSVSMPKVCPAQQGDTAACTLVERLVSQLLTSHSVWNLGHNFCKYCRAYTTANINWTVDSTQQHLCRCSECNFAERPQLSISGDSLELSAYLARSRLGLIRCPRVRTATISDPPNCTCTLGLYLMPLTISWQFCYF